MSEIRGKPIKYASHSLLKTVPLTRVSFAGQAGSTALAVYLDVNIPLNSCVSASKPRYSSAL